MRAKRGKKIRTWDERNLRRKRECAGSAGEQRSQDGVGKYDLTKLSK